MRNTLLDPFEDIPRGVVVTANDYAAGSSFPAHMHRRGQFAFASCGTISVDTPKVAGSSRLDGPAGCLRVFPTE